MKDTMVRVEQAKVDIRYGLIHNSLPFYSEVVHCITVYINETGCITKCLCFLAHFMK